MRMSWNQHALDKVWTILMPDYPFDDTAFTHFHIRPGKDVSKPYNAITSPNIKHGYGTASGDLPGKDDSPGKAMSAVVPVPNGRGPSPDKSGKKKYADKKGIQSNGNTSTGLLRS